MGNPQVAESAAVLRMLPSTDDLLMSSVAERLMPEAGRKRLTSLARRVIEELRTEITNNVSGRAGREEVYSKESLLEAASKKLNGLWISHRASRLREVINATGVVIHTNLGRAPLSTDAIRAIQNAAGYCTLE